MCRIPSKSQHEAPILDVGASRSLCCSSSGFPVLCSSDSKPHLVTCLTFRPCKWRSALAFAFPLTGRSRREDGGLCERDALNLYFWQERFKKRGKVGCRGFLLMFYCYCALKLGHLWNRLYPSWMQENLLHCASSLGGFYFLFFYFSESAGTERILLEFYKPTLLKKHENTWWVIGVLLVESLLSLDSSCSRSAWPPHCWTPVAALWHGAWSRHELHALSLGEKSDDDERRLNPSDCVKSSPSSVPSRKAIR